MRLPSGFPIMLFMLLVIYQSSSIVYVSKYACSHPVACRAARIKDPGNNEETETGERSTMRWTVRS